MEFQLDGAKMVYERQGESGRPLVLLHGWGGSHESFAPLIRDLSADHRILAVDFPGHGRSPEPPQPWEVTQFAHLTRALMEQEGFLHADVVAHSFGGRVALLLAAEDPNLFDRMLLTGCAGLPNRTDAKLSARTRRYKRLRRLADNGVTRALFGGKVDIWREKLIQRYGSADYKALTPSMRQTFNRVLAQDLTWCVDKIKNPVLLVWGKDDTATPIWMGEYMQEHMADAALIPFEGCGHFAYLEAYSRFLAIAREFLKNRREADAHQVD